MNNEKIFQMDFGKLYSPLLSKAVKKGRTKAEVDQVISWLTEYSEMEIEKGRISSVRCVDFFSQTPRLTPDRTLVTGVICGVRVEDVEDPLMHDIRRLDKLIDELAKGRPMEKILRRVEGNDRWVCPKCGRSFKNPGQTHYCGKTLLTIKEYILNQPEDV